MFYSNGQVYQGQWNKGTIHGYGIYIHDASKEHAFLFSQNNSFDEGNQPQYQNAYQGFWKNGKANGIGFQIFQDGSKFFGNFEDNMKKWTRWIYMAWWKIIYRRIS